MPRFEGSRERKGPRGSSPRRGFKGRFKGNDRRDSDREPKHFRRDRRDVERTEVTCSSCGTKCEVPFKPTSNKPVYCDDCFAKKGGKLSGKDLEMINEKLNKIMKALKIE